MLLRPCPASIFTSSTTWSPWTKRDWTFRDLGAAREQALESARELVCEAVHKGYLNLDHRIEIEDDQGERLLVLTFRDAFTVTGEIPCTRPPNPQN